MERVWKDYYENLCEEPDEEFSLDNHPKLQRQSKNREKTPPVLASEVSRNRRCLSKGKAVGIDEIAQEMLKASGSEITSWLTWLYNKAVTGDLPEEWS